MAVLVKKVELTWLDRTYVWPILKGMRITMQHFLKQITTSSRKRFTVQYPEWKREPAPGYRGLHELKRFEDASIKCVACFMCAEACPARCITIESEEFGDMLHEQGQFEKRPKVFKIDMLRCIYCGMCEEACPKDAIWLRNDYEQASYDRLSMQFGKWDLMNTYAEKDGKPLINEDPTPTVPRKPILT
jgi:NADH-quinone oxidoreductase subunit I